MSFLLFLNIDFLIANVYLSIKAVPSLFQYDSGLIRGKHQTGSWLEKVIVIIKRQIVMLFT